MDVTTFRDRALSLLFPPVCLGCGGLEGAATLDLGLCARCRGRLVRADRRSCLLCADPLPAAAGAPQGYACGECWRRPPKFERLIALWTYEPPLDRVIRGLKFGGLAYLAGHLAAEVAARHGPALRRSELVVPVPLHWRRRLARGYDQAEQLAHALARRLGRPAVKALRRRRATRPQTGLDRERRAANVRGAFRPARRSGVGGRDVLLVDDVVTTGATLGAAAGCLKTAGAASVVAIVAAKRLRPCDSRPEAPGSDASPAFFPWDRRL